ncbi:hypothetical protein C8N38_102206 [Rhodovulum kholense]|uniref:Uncharacterized protein n=1 Tax=Rhodovulum kholense TaxID=453584 RepID=A0A8E2VMZ6_9RHOB|nr:hypothetical protein C8N38_102206 [Rhodovulum kholense]
MRRIAFFGCRHDSAQLVQSKLLDQAAGNLHVLGHEPGQFLTERRHIFENLDDQVHQLQFTCTSHSCGVRRTSFEHRLFVPPEKLCGVQKLMAKRGHHPLKPGAICNHLKVVMRQRRPTTASMAFFMVAVVKGLRTMLLSPNC